MGNTASHEDNDPLDPFDGIDTLGYRVLGVQPNSPAAAAGLVSFLDFLVGVNGTMMLGSGQDLKPGEEYDDVDLPAVLEENKEKPVEFLVWNIKSQSARLVNLTPSDTWGGAGLLGVTIRLDNYAGAEDRLVRVLSVEPQSPAAIAGLVPEKDFLLGTTHQTLDSVDRLARLLHAEMDRVVELYVYNTETDIVRVVALMPTLKWGDGDGILGAEVGTGYLHRLPFTSRETAGTSVERRVRYVQETDEDDVVQHRVELEPQLEMEPEEDEERESAAKKGIREPVDVPKVVETPSTATVEQPPAQQAETRTPVKLPPMPSILGPPPSALGPPPQIYSGGTAFKNSNVKQYTRPSYELPPPPPPAFEKRQAST